MHQATRSAVTPLALILSLTLLAASPARPAELTPVPEPALERMEPAVRELLRERWTALSSATGNSEILAAHVELGRLAMAYDLFEPAAACWINAELLEPENFRWPYLSGFIDQAHGRFASAIEAYSRAASLAEATGESYGPLFLRWARAELERRRPEAAKALFERAAEVGPLNAAARYGLGQIAAEAGDATEATRHFGAVLAAQPAAKSVHHPLGMAWRQLGDLERARHHLRQAGEGEVQFPDPVIAGATTAATGAGYHHVLGTEASLEGDAARAIEEFEKALAIDPELTGTRLSLARELAGLGRLDAARAELEEALRRAPENPQAHYELGRTLTLLSGTANLPAAEASFRRALELAPEYESARLALGAVLAAAGRFAEAAEVYGELARQSAEPLEARRRQAAALVQAGDLAAALAAYRAVLEDAPEDVEAHYNLALVAGMTGDFATAEEHLGRVVELDPGDHQARFQRARALVELGRLDDAVGVLEGLLEVVEDPAGRAAAQRLLAELRGGGS